jgi:hypothetical protein
LSKYIIEGSRAGEHGLGIKVGRETRLVGEEGAPKGFGVMVEGCTQFTSPLLDEEVILTMKETTIALPKKWVGGRIIKEGTTKL